MHNMTYTRETAVRSDFIYRILFHQRFASFTHNYLYRFLFKQKFGNNFYLVKRIVKNVWEGGGSTASFSEEKNCAVIV